MRRISEYDTRDWLRGLPVVHGFKQTRNDLSLQLFLRQRAAGMARFMDELRALEADTLVAVVAFERPDVLGWLLFEAREHLHDMRLVVFDNSRHRALRPAIAAVCAKNRIPYLPLPWNPTHHVNRSHGRAMTWIHHNVFRPLAPKRFGFIDHDLIPIHRFSLTERMGSAAVYGLRQPSEFHLRRWSLWAGYCFYDTQAVASRRLNFLYDFGAGLDTGGRNWSPLYRGLDALQLPVAREEAGRLHPTGLPEQQVSVLDRAWMHIASVSYNDNYRGRKAYFDALEARRRAGTPWDELITLPADAG